MASKILIRSGASLLNRLSSSFLHQRPNPNHQIVSHGLGISPKLFPSISQLPNSLQLPRNHAELLKKLASEGKATKGGRRVIARRIAKGRSRITA